MEYFDSLADITNEKLFEGDFTMTDEQFERLARRHIDDQGAVTYVFNRIVDIDAIEEVKVNE